MAVSFIKLLAILSFGILMSWKLTSARRYCDSFSHCILLQTCRNYLGNPRIPKIPEIERTYAAICKAYRCSDAIKEAYGQIPDSSPVLSQCASLPVRGTPSRTCLKVLLEVFSSVVIPSNPYWLRVSVENYYSTFCHIIQCLKGHKGDSTALIKWISNRANLPKFN
ncbi:UNVERIFIED_CONTAM: hypothetical protein RMT77_005460 [Armadillidium vulgare]